MVELLVVVAIIAILLTILLPSIKMSRSAARGNVCLGNQAKLIVGSLVYATDYDGEMPFCHWGTGGRGWLFKSRGGLYNFVYNTPEGRDVVRREGLLYPMIGNLDFYRCPDDKGPYDNVRVYFARLLTSYHMNGSICGYGRAEHNPRTGAMVDQSMYKANDIIFYEADENFWLWNDGSNFPSEGVSKRHKDGSNVASIDASVEWLPYKVLWNQHASGGSNPKPNRMWNYPGSRNGR